MLKKLALVAALASVTIPALSAVVEVENNGSMGTATPVSLSGAGTETLQGAVTVNPADGLADFDFFFLGQFTAPGFIQVSTESGGGLDPFIGLYNAAGVLVASDDDSGPGIESLLSFNVTIPGDYTLVVRGFGSNFPNDPFSLTPGNPIGSQGTYTATVQYRGAVGTIPEPASLALAGLALAGLGLGAGRRRASKAG